ncbi:MAG: CHAT domain-containing protein [Cyanophyceae cyanobacterium]
MAFGHGQRWGVIAGTVSAAVALAVGGSLGRSDLAWGQAIAPAPDGTGTQVTYDGSNATIDGGQRSGDRGNLFHSFERFGLNAGESAIFLADPDLRNIFGRVVGGGPSAINGLIQVGGGSPNLVLMNPAGWVFGPNAALNVPADFTVTTASGVGFGTGAWWSLESPGSAPDWGNLLGEPIAYQFGPAVAIAQGGHLRVNPGQSLTMMGGAIAQDGTLTAPGGTVALLAVPGTSRVRLAPPGSVLGLEVETLALNAPTDPLTLPSLLTGAAPTEATRATIAIAAGTTQVTGQISTAADGVGGTVALLGDRVVLLGGDVNSSGDRGGGQIFIGGHWRGGPLLPTATLTHVDRHSHLSADALSSGPGGEIVLWADHTTQFFGTLTARGGAQPGDRGGQAEISGRQNLTYRGQADLSSLAGPWGSLLLDPTNLLIVSSADPNTDTDAPLADGILSATEGGDTFTLGADSIQDILGDVRLEATNDITVAEGVSLLFSTPRGTALRTITFQADADGDGAGAFRMDPTQAIIAPQSNLTISGAAIAVGDIFTAGLTGPSGAINLTATTGNLTAGRLDTTADQGSGGAIRLNAPTGQMTVEALLTLSGDGPGGAINLASGGDLRVTNSILTSGTGDGAGGNFTAIAGGNLFLNDVTLNALGSGAGGNATLRSGGTLAVESLDLTAQTGLGGSATLSAQGEVSLAQVRLGTEQGDRAATDPRSTLTLDTPGTLTWTGSDRLVGGADGALVLGRTVPLGGLVVGDRFNTGGSALDLTLARDVSFGTPLVTAGGDLSLGATGNFTLTAPPDTADGAGTGDGIPGVIRLRSGGDLTVAVDLRSFGPTAGGRLELTSGGAIAVANLDVSSATGTGGAIAMEASGNLITGNLAATGNRAGGQIDLTSANGILTTGNLDVSARTGPGGTITLTAPAPNLAPAAIAHLNELTFEEIPPADPANADANPNANPNAPTPAPAPIFVSDRIAGEIITGNLAANGTDGGTITITARSRYTGGFLSARGLSGLGGTVRIDPENDIDLTAIDVQGETTGGTAILQAQRFIRLRETFRDRAGQATSIAAGGNASDGTIQIAHGSTDLQPPRPFTVGDATLNGTAGSLSSGTSTIEPVAEFFGPVQQGNISLIATAVTPPTPSPPVPPPDNGNNGGGNPIGPGLDGDGEPQPRSQDLDRPEAPPRLDDAIARVNRGVGDLSSLAFNLFNLTPRELSLAYEDSETAYIDEYATYFSRDRPIAVGMDQARETLQRIERETGVRPALLYVRFQYDDADEQTAANAPLQLMLVTPNGPTVVGTVAGTRREEVLRTVSALRGSLTSPLERMTDNYLPRAQLLYRWILEPMASRLEALGIENIAFVMDEGLRSLPIAALHDGDRFLIETYSVGLVPSLSLTDARYVDLSKAPVRLLGASKFQELPALPAVPEELALIQRIRSGEIILNNDLTLEALKQTSDRGSAQILHLATHAEFKPGSPSESYIQLWDQTRLPLDRVREMGWDNPTVDLLTLSACRTALGDRNAELGFAGLAVAAGVRTVLASFWYVSDTGTLALMGEFYEQQKTAPIKAEALRQAQLALLRGTARFEGNNLVGSFGSIPIPDSLLNQGSLMTQHPYFWAAFTTIGSPW